MNYCTLSNTWIGLSCYNLNGFTPKKVDIYEGYVAPVTLSFPEWQKYIASGNNILLGSGGVIPGGTVGGSVYKGHVRQGIQ
jgi:hypothetical protein